MTTSPQDWKPVERLDTERMAADLEHATGVRVIVDGPCPGGEVGAAYVRWDDGHRSILKWRPQTTLEDMQAGPLKVVSVLRSVGYPAPETELAAQVGDAVVTIQELLPGTTVNLLNESTLDQALALNDLQAGILTEHQDVPNAKLYLVEDGPGFCLHGPLRQYSRRTARLEKWIAEVGACYPERFAGDDAMHLDFHPGNLLAQDGKLTGVIDWDGAARGDRRFDLVTLRFGAHPYPPHLAPAARVDRGVENRLDEILDSFPPDVLRPLWAHMSLRMTDWTIRHFTPDQVDHWLDLAEQRLDQPSSHR
ncbi:phosphotransferase [Kribbella sp. NPDC006257]|uniref:phosphotransferase family protein n=1 Tax=Kribbella sp. NPDC006257 TaxID=3156738 RepID=UPI0033B7522C